MSQCPVCGNALTWVEQYKQWYCYSCKAYRQPAPQAAPAAPQAAPPAPGGLWFQPFYRIRKKVLALTNQYWIENAQGQALGFSKQKMFRIKEDIRIFADESQTQELFRIQQLNWTNTWGEFAVVDTATNTAVGYVQRKALKSMFASSWEIYDPWKRLVGAVGESSGRGLARRLLPGGGLVPQKTTLQLNGQPVAVIDQQFKVIGDMWDINCQWTPPQFDRRVLLACALLMGMIERQQS